MAVCTAQGIIKARISFSSTVTTPDKGNITGAFGNNRPGVYLICGIDLIAPTYRPSAYVIAVGALIGPPGGRVMDSQARVTGPLFPVRIVDPIFGLYAAYGILMAVEAEGRIIGQFRAVKDMGRSAGLLIFTISSILPI